MRKLLLILAVFTFLGGENSFAQNPIPAPESNYNDQAISQFRKATFLSGLLVNSIAVPRTLEMTDSRALAAGLLTAGASYFAPKYLIRDENITQASADAYSQFFTRGYLHSILLNAHLKSSEVSGDSPISFDQRKGINTLLFSNLEAYGHFALARAFNASEGAIALSKNLHDITFANALFYTIAADNYSAEALVYPSIVGSATAYYLGNLTNYTRGDAHVSSAASVLGSATGMWFYYSMDKLGDGEIMETGNGAQAYATASVLGGIAGIALGHYLAKKFDLERRIGLEAKLTVFAAGLLGAGVGLLVDPDDPYAMLTGGVVGAFAGGLTMSRKFQLFRSNAPKPKVY